MSPVPARSGWQRAAVDIEERELCVLGVEDEAFIRMDAADVLSEAGFRVIEAANAEETIAACERGGVDLLFTDFNMPGMNGLDLSAVVHTRWRDIGLLITSGRHDIPVEVIPDHGLFLDKPYSPDDLVRMVSRCLDLRHL